MQRMAFACAAFMILASPLRAQQAPPDQSLPAVPEQAVPPAAPPPTQSESPPPFVPPPPARVYNYHYSRTHHHMTAHHRAAAHRHSAAGHHATHERQRLIHVSKHTSRQCHRMSYVQIVRHSTCRELMSWDLKVAEHRHSHGARHRASYHHGLAHHHRASHHRG